MITWSILKTKPFINFEDAEKFVRHFKFVNPKCRFKAGVANGDIVVFVISKGAEVEAPA